MSKVKKEKRRRIRFDLLRTCVIALRGHKKTAAPDG